MQLHKINITDEAQQLITGNQNYYTVITAREIKLAVLLVIYYRCTV